MSDTTNDIDDKKDLPNLETLSDPFGEINMDNIPEDIRTAWTEGSGSDYVRDIAWVYDNLGVNIKSIPLRGCPGPGAWRLLLWAKDENVGKFYDLWKAIVAPSKKQLDEAAQFKDTGDDIVGLINRVDKYWKKEGKSGRIERGVSTNGQI